MTKLILSTSNIMGGGPSVIRRPASRSQKSNTELIHAFQANFAGAQQAIEEAEADPSTNGHANNVNGTSPTKPLPYTSWTAQQDLTLFVPALDFTESGLAEERSQYEITVKLFFLANTPASCRCEQTREAIDLVLQELHVSSVDLVIISYPGISFDAEDEGTDSQAEANATADSVEKDLQSDARAEDTNTMLATWACLEDLQREGTIARLGVAEFGTDRLSKFLKRSKIRPSVDQINVRDCCVVPKPLIMYAKEENVELLTHNDCTNILPSGTLRELLGPSEGGFGVLADSRGTGEGLKGDVEPQWVIKYTAVVRDRGVIENKGYFAAAEVRDGK